MNRSHVLPKIALLSVVILVHQAGADPIPFHEPFANNSIVLARVGGFGVGANISTSASPVFLDEYRITSGAGASAVVTYAQTLNIPSTGAQRVTNQGSGIAELRLNRTSAGGNNYLFFAGYDAPPGATGFTSAAPTTVPRVVTRVDQTGVINSTTRLTTSFSAPPTAAVSVDGTNIVVGADFNAGGVRQTTLGSNTSTSVAPLNNIQGLAPRGADLFATGGISDNAVYSISGGVATQLFTSTSGRLFDLFFAGSDTLYVADDGGNDPNMVGGLLRYDYNGTSWQYKYRIEIPLGTITGLKQGLRDLSGIYDPDTGRVDIYGTTAENRNGRLIGITDDLDNTLASQAAVSELLADNPFSVTGSTAMWRGVEIIPEPTSLALLGLAMVAGLVRRR
jgi:hypothetical protein